MIFKVVFCLQVEEWGGGGCSFYLVQYVSNKRGVMGEIAKKIFRPKSQQFSPS